MVKLFGLASVQACVFASIGLAVQLTGCSTTEPVATTIQPAGEFSLDAILAPGSGQVGCRKMLDTFCSALHAPSVQGNISVGIGPDSLPVLEGETKNDFSSEYFLYSTAKLRAKDALPADFRNALENQNYFDTLVRSLNRSPRAQMSLERRATSLRRDFELDKVWNAAVAETVLRRISLKFKGYHRLRDDLIPLEQSVERLRTRRELISEISRAIWKHDPNWSKVELSFEILRHRFLSVIEALDIPDEVRRHWKERINSVELVIPGAIPAIADSECSTTQANAFYYPHLNLITVCAGDFNSEDILQTVAHELAHSLDLGRSIYVFQKASSLGRALATLRQEVCTASNFSCGSWANFKTEFQAKIDELKTFKQELPEFQKCLKKRKTSKVISEDDIQRLAEKAISDQVSNLARSGVFLRITKEEVPLADGKTNPNPNYLNPCGYKTWSQGDDPIDDELTQLLFFTAEYRCNSHSDAKDKLRLAITASKEMAIQVSKAAIRMEGEFSDREDLEVEGFSSSPVERFADVIGSYAFATYLTGLKEKTQRRLTFLASSSWQCEKPSLESLYPEENSVEQAFVFDPHSETEMRKKEMFSHPIRDALECTEDFQFQSCELNFKHEVKP